MKTSPRPKRRTTEDNTPVSAQPVRPNPATSSDTNIKPDDSGNDDERNIRDRTRERAEEARDTLADSGRVVAAHVDETTDAVLEYARRNPVTTAGIALLVGAVAATLLARR